MVVVRVIDAILMLKQVDRHNSPMSKEPRNAKVNQGGLPIKDRQHRNKQNYRSTFTLHTLIEVRLLPPPPRYVQRFVVVHDPDNCKGKGQKV